MGKIVPAVLAAALLWASPGAANEPAVETVEELRRLNAAVERMTVLMERLVDERRTEVLQRQLEVGNGRLAGIEGRLLALQSRREELLGMEQSLVSEARQLARPIPDIMDTEAFRMQRRQAVEENEVRTAEARAAIADIERRISDLEVEEADARIRRAELLERIRARLGLEP